MTLAVMQPYFLPYIGYFQLLHAVDCFVMYDNIEFSKKGWIHRNRILVNGQPAYITLPLRKDSDFLDVCDRRLADDFPAARGKMLRQVEGAYRKAPFFEPTMALFRDIMETPEANLFRFLHRSVEKVKQHLGIATPVVISSALPVDHSLRREEKLFALCRHFGADRYVNSIGGQALYAKPDFAARGVALSFLQTTADPYPQAGGEFVPYLSVLDVLMFNSVEDVRGMLSQYRLV